MSIVLYIFLEYIFLDSSLWLDELAELKVFHGFTKYYKFMKYK